MKFFRLLIIISIVLVLFCFPISSILAKSDLSESSKNLTSTITKTNFNINDQPQLNLITNSSKNIFTKIISTLTRSPNVNLQTQTKITLLDSQDHQIDSDAIKVNSSSTNKLGLEIDTNYLKPGKYTIQIVDTTTQETILQDFTWGVLAINPDKSVYQVGDTAIFSMAVLDDFGDMVCNAELNLIITDPKGKKITLSTTNNLITINPSCRSVELTNIPDYQSNLTIQSLGTYHYTLTATTLNGTYSTDNSFIVSNQEPFIIKRLTATRIYPANVYPVDVEIIANQDFAGTIFESVPLSFKINPQPTSQTTTKDNRQLISWPVDLKKGQSLTISYSYQAPFISPEYYLLGPLTFNQDNQIIYTEPRQWQIASDATTDSVTFRWRNDDGFESNSIGDTWYDTNYTYRTPINVSNAGTSQTNFQVRLTIGTSALIANGKMQSDCDDLRFSDSDKQSKLSYWIESACNVGTTTIVWVKIPTLATGTTRTIYAYYGYNSAIIDSNGDDTFDFFDDFVGTTLNPTKWTEWDPNSWGTMSISGGTMALFSSESGTTAGHGIVSANPFQFSNHRFESYNLWNLATDPGGNSDYQQQVFRIGSSNPTSVQSGPSYAYSFYTSQYDSWGPYYGHIFDSYNSSGSGSNFYDDWNYDDGTSNKPSTFRISQLNWYNTNTLTTKESTNRGNSWTTYESSNSVYTSNVVNMANPQNFGTYIEASQSVGVSIAAWTDWIRIRKYAGTEPTFGLGTETTIPMTSDGATWMTAENVGITGVPKESNLRLRFSIKNTGTGDTLNLRLQVAPLGASAGCTEVPSASFTDVPTSNGTYAVMTTSPNFTNQDTTTNQLTDSSTTFIAGKIVEYNSNQSDDISLDTNAFTEVEYNFQMLSGAGNNTDYCFRVVDVGTTLNTYTQIASLTTGSGYNQIPLTPTLISPIDTATNISQTPSFVTVTTDGDSDNLQYEIRYCTDSAMSVGCSTFTATHTGWSGADVGTSSYSSGTTATYVLQTGNSLATNTTYYWKTRAIDPNGSNNWSSTQATPYSFTTLNHSPSAPTLIYPNNGATGVTLSPTLRLVATDSDNDSLKYKIILATNASFTGTTQTFDQTITNIGWSGQNVGSSAYSSGTTASYTIQTPLNTTTTYWWKAQAIDYSVSSTWGNLSVGYSFTTINGPPTSPTSLLTENQTNPTGIIDTNPEFSAIYNDPDAGDVANKYQIQVDNDSNFASTVWDSGASGTVMTNCTVNNRCNDISYTGTTLTRGTLYYWRIRYWDDSNDAGDWSTGTNTFTLNSLPNTPTNTTPPDNATKVSLSPNLVASTFSDPDAGNTQSASQWQISTNSSFTAIVYDTGTSASASNSHTITTTLNIGTTYFWHTRYQDNNGDWSSYSTATKFYTTNQPPLNQPSLIWHFDEGFNTTTYSAKSSHFASLSNATWTSNGQNKKAISFNGNNSLVSINSTTNLDFDSANFTVSAWINPASNSGVQSIFSSSKYIFYIENGYLKFQRSNTPYETITSGTTIPTNQWTHVLFTRSSTSSNQSYLYINGYLSQTGTIPTLGSSATSPAFGYQVTNGRYFNGLIDEIHIFNSSLNTNEIKQDYNQLSKHVLGATTSYNQSTCISGDDSTCSAPIAEWNLNQNVGTSSPDRSTNNHHLYIASSPANPLWFQGKIGSGLLFDGVNDYASVGSTLINIQSVSFWIKPNSTTQSIVDFDNGTHYLTLSSGTISANGFSSPLIYINGIQTNTGINPYLWSHITIITSTPFDATKITFGKYSSNFFGGNLDEIKIYSYSRTPAQVAYDYNHGAPVSWWKFNENSNTTTYDWSGQGHHGNIIVGPSGSQDDIATARANGASGRYNRSIYLDGTDDYVSVGDIGTSVSAVSFWIKPNSTTQNLFQLSAGAYASISSGNISVTGFGTATIYVDGQLSSIITDTNWHHITILASDNIYANQIYLGRISSNYFAGQIDEFRIYTFNPTVPQIRAIYNNSGVNFN